MMETANHITGRQPANNRMLRSESAKLKPGKKVAIGPRRRATDNPDGTSSAVVNVQRGEHGVETIEVVCPCGERILIRCQYDQ